MKNKHPSIIGGRVGEAPTETTKQDSNNNYLESMLVSIRRTNAAYSTNGVSYETF